MPKWFVVLLMTPPAIWFALEMYGCWHRVSENLRLEGYVDRRKPWQKMRYWVLGIFLLVLLLDYLSNGLVLRVLEFLSAGNCRDINHMTGNCW